MRLNGDEKDLTSMENRGTLQIGQLVRVDDRSAVGHCRAPWYLRGQVGEIVEVLGVFRDPEKLAYHKPGVPRIPLFKVRFKQSQIWPGYVGSPRDVLEADLTANWLVSALFADRHEKNLSEKV
ncbi:MAG: nitrile hydratase subunit beta [Hyphomicrobiaceae bacterium]|nr:nitrile hydratase subunit beta [Hyphomicrobiaceae bacterium]